MRKQQICSCALVGVTYVYHELVIKSWFGNYLMLSDKNRTIFNLKYCKGFLILVLGKRMKILYYFKPFDTKIIIRQVDYFLFLLAISSKYNFFHLFLIAVVNLVRKQLLRFYGD